MAMHCINRYRNPLLLLPLLTLAGCSGVATVPLHYLNPDPAVTWPQLPEVPRYSYVGELRGEHNFLPSDAQPAQQGILDWLVGIIAGRRQPQILQQPQTVTTDATGKVYVTDIGRGAVFVFDTENQKLQLWEWAESAQRFVSPIGMAIGTDNTLLVTDSELAVVVRLNSDGEPVSQFGAPFLKRPTGIARDPANGRIYVADTHAHDIKVFDDSGQLVDTLGTRGNRLGEFNFPTYLSFANERLYVTDRLNSRIQIFNPEGDRELAFGERGLYVGNLPHPKGVAADNDGNIYVVESYYDHLLIYNDKGELLLPIGGSGNKVGQFYLPAGVWVDNNRIYIADMYNSRVVVLQYLGQ